MIVTNVIRNGGRLTKPRVNNQRLIFSSYTNQWLYKTMFSHKTLETRLRL
ncbi:hypothetical protein CREGCYN_02740 [Synechococcus sp. M16CYN]